MLKEAKVLKNIISMYPAAPAEQNFVKIHKTKDVSSKDLEDDNGITNASSKVKTFNRKKNRFGNDEINSIKSYDENVYVDDRLANAHKKKVASRHLFDKTGRLMDSDLNSRTNSEAVRRFKELYGKHRKVTVVKEAEEKIKVGDYIHMGLKTKGGAGFRGHVAKIDNETNEVHLKLPKDSYTMFGERIIKGHISKCTKESEENITERDMSNKAKKDSFVARKGLEKDIDDSASEKQKNRLVRRGKIAGRAKLKEEEQLDEISKGLARRYLQKSIDDQKEIHNKVKKTPYDDKEKVVDALSLRKKNREQGMYNAIDKIGGQAKVGVSEEYVGFKKLDNHIKDEGYSKKAAGAIAASIGRKKYGAKKFNKMAHESVQLDEFFAALRNKLSNRKSTTANVSTTKPVDKTMNKTETTDRDSQLAAAKERLKSTTTNSQMSSAKDSLRNNSEGPWSRQNTRDYQMSSAKEKLKNVTSFHDRFLKQKPVMEPSKLNAQLDDAKARLSSTSSSRDDQLAAAKAKLRGYVAPIVPNTPLKKSNPHFVLSNTNKKEKPHFKLKTEEELNEISKQLVDKYISKAKSDIKSGKYEFDAPKIHKRDNSIRTAYLKLHDKKVNGTKVLASESEEIKEDYKPSTEFHVVSKGDSSGNGTVKGKYSTIKRARNARDKHDNAYGSYHHHIKYYNKDTKQYVDIKDA